MDKIASNNRELNTMNQISPRAETDKEMEIRSDAGIHSPGSTPHIECKMISRDGDTLEVSAEGEKKARKLENGVIHDTNVPDKKIIREDEKMSDSELINCTKSRLKQLYDSQLITKKQYEKFMKTAK
ncbi:MAG: hypothetical protein K6G83_01555 [Lachnospiraceae bacterium]|nr:hypothetical protein [Lachnospiraceae bacterium]